MPPKNPRVQMVREWLETLHLEQYADMFAAAGYDDPEAISTLDEGDLDAMRITLPGHRKRLLLNAKKFEEKYTEKSGYFWHPSSKVKNKAHHIYNGNPDCRGFEISSGGCG
eukprot:m.104774 g.104774  ORF g.104774 m.104774 type:complete len:111 (+) comp13856_c0_seq2:184-516(+)